MKFFPALNHGMAGGRPRGTVSRAVTAVSGLREGLCLGLGQGLGGIYQLVGLHPPETGFVRCGGCGR